MTLRFAGGIPSPAVFFPFIAKHLEYSAHAPNPRLGRLLHTVRIPLSRGSHNGLRGLEREGGGMTGNDAIGLLCNRPENPLQRPAGHGREVEDVG
jgi:hypothetical protein